jgi:hypothetical protein
MGGIVHKQLPRRSKRCTLGLGVEVALNNPNVFFSKRIARKKARVLQTIENLVAADTSPPEYVNSAITVEANDRRFNSEAARSTINNPQVIHIGKIIINMLRASRTHMTKKIRTGCGYRTVA